MEIAILALGCFWGPEINFSKLEGVESTEVGYCGGNHNNTNYKEVCSAPILFCFLIFPCVFAYLG